jgi:hypothetical protein
MKATPSQKPKIVRPKDPWEREYAARVRRYRTSIDRQLLEELKEFVKTGSPEEKRFMKDILSRRDSNTHGYPDLNEIPLLPAFESVARDIDADDAVFRVPDELRNNVVDYLKWLRSNKRELEGYCG